MSKRASREGTGPASLKGAVSDPATTNSRDSTAEIAVIVIPGMRALLSTCAPQMVHLQTAWNSTTKIKEVRRANAVMMKDVY